MKEDLRMYVEEEMATMHGDEEFKNAIATELVRKADGNFLWATFVLSEVLRCHTQDSVLEALEDVPGRTRAIVRTNGLYASKELPTFGSSHGQNHTDLDRLLKASFEFVGLG